MNDPASQPPVTVAFRPERTTVAVVIVMLLGALPLGLSSPWLAPVLLMPFVVLVWVLRARVRANAGGIEVCNGLRVRRVAWTDVDAIDLPRRGPVLLRTTRGDALRLTALARRDVRALVAVGSGP